MIKQKPVVFLAFLFALILSACHTTQRLSSGSAASIAFYNVENLFDTVDDPLTLDEEFTPEGRLKWTSERYLAKLNSLSRVISEMGLPTFLGLAEVENEAVLADMSNHELLKSANYGIAHFDSPDIRGIDVALLYNKTDFNVLQSDIISIQFPIALIENEPDYTTRDILVVKGIYKKKDTLNILVAHWPSRRGGEKESEPKRVYVAEQMRKKVDEIFKMDPNANIIIMGDLNDETNNIAVAETLRALPLSSPLLPSKLYNCFSELDAADKGTYHFRGNWNMLDHIILSASLLKPTNRLHFSKPEIFQRDWMMYNDPTYGPSPNRTYGGERYFGGISDHLPVIMK